MSAELTDEEIERIVEPVYEAYRLGKYGKQEYLPMWHQLEDKPTRTLEATIVIGAVTSIVAAHVRRALEDAAATLGTHYLDPTNRPTDAESVSEDKAYNAGIYHCFNWLSMQARAQAAADPRETKD